MKEMTELHKARDLSCSGSMISELTNSNQKMLVHLKNHFRLTKYSEIKG